MHSRNSYIPAVALVALLAGVSAVSFSRAFHLQYDFHHFYLDARYVWDRGALNTRDTPLGEDLSAEQSLAHTDNPPRHLSFYLPVVPLLIAPLTAAGVMPAAVLWAVMHVASILAVVAVLRTGPPNADRRPAPDCLSSPTLLFAALALAVPAFYENARFNQLSFVVLALVLGAFLALERRRPALAGAILGVAVVIKLLPAIFGVWLILKRQWTALAAMVVAAVVVAVVPCVVAFGFNRTVEYHRIWLEQNVLAASRPGGAAIADAARSPHSASRPTARAHFVDYRNQSIPAVVARHLGSDDPRGANLRRWLVGGMWGILFAALVFATRRPWTALSPIQRRAEVALCLIAMIVLSPLLRTYYLVWATPALAVFAAAIVDPRHALRADPRRSTRRLALFGILAWIAGMVGWLSTTARDYGVHLWMLVAMGALLVAIARRRPDEPPTVGQPEG